MLVDRCPDVTAPMDQLTGPSTNIGTAAGTGNGATRLVGSHYRRTHGLSLIHI